MIPIIEKFNSIERVGIINHWRILINRLIKDSKFYVPFIILTGLLILISTGVLEGTQYAVYTAMIIAFIRLLLKIIEPLKPEDFHWVWENVKDGVYTATDAIDAVTDTFNTTKDN